jgi:alanine dehydrogenase
LGFRALVDAGDKVLVEHDADALSSFSGHEYKTSAHQRCLA